MSTHLLLDVFTYSHVHSFSWHVNTHTHTRIHAHTLFLGLPLLWTSCTTPDSAPATLELGVFVCVGEMLNRIQERRRHETSVTCLPTQPAFQLAYIHTPSQLPQTSVPAIVLYHVGQLDDKLTLLVLLTALKRMLLKRGEKGV